MSAENENTVIDEFIFFGSAAEQIQLVGNAVPPLLAQRIGESLIQQLQIAKPTYSQGALLSFIPTVADGVSPALRNVMERVNQHYGNWGRVFDNSTS